MEYPITPGYLDSVPEKLVRLYQNLDDFVISDICRRFRQSGSATETALEQIRQLQRRGYDIQDIEEEIRRVNGVMAAELEKIFEDAVARNQKYYDYTITKTDIAQEPFRESEMEAEIAAIRDQTKGEFQNITGSLGFAVRGADGKVDFLPIADTYQKVLDDAEMKVWTGAESYEAAIRTAVKQLSDSGLQMIDYASGWHNRIDVAARRAIVTGVGKISDRYSDQLAAVIDTNYFEVSAHIGARDLDGPKGWESHKAWQGKVYYKSQNGEPDPLGQYKDLAETTGYGDVAGLCGANCRHKKFPFVPGVSERTYTDEELENIDPPPFEYQGRTYTAYEATQKMRQIETALRKYKRKAIGSAAAGLDQNEAAARARILRLNEEYKNFSKAAGLRTQPERAMAESPNNYQPDGLARTAKSDIIQSGGTSGALSPDSKQKNMQSDIMNLSAR